VPPGVLMLASLSDRALNRLAFLLLLGGLVCMAAMWAECIIMNFMLFLAPVPQAIVHGAFVVVPALVATQWYALFQVATWLSGGAFPHPDQRLSAARQIAVIAGVAVWLLAGIYAALSWRQPGWLGIRGWMAAAALFCFAIASVSLIGVVRMWRTSPHPRGAKDSD
jgi:hypothetical protein